MKQIFAINNGIIVINGEEIVPPKRAFGNSGLNITQYNDRLFVNGYEWCNGKWKRTLAAIWHYLF